MADDDKTKKPDEPEKLNKAQAEFQKYMKRMQEGGAAFFMPGGEGMPGWAVPPSVAMMPGPGGHGFFAAMPQAGTFPEGSLSHRLGSTIRLGVDVINAALAGSVRILNGIAGAYGGEQYGHGYGHAGCGCGCDCCGDDCCGVDCCGCECCNPGVGTCC